MQNIVHSTIENISLAHRTSHDTLTLFTFDPNWLEVLSAHFMQYALIGSIFISLAAGIIGYFTIARRATFASHALAHIGLPGATGAVLLGLPVSFGLGCFTLVGAMVIGILGKKASQREIATGSILAFATGLGLFFARLSTAATQQMQSILFGSILTITTEQLIGFAIFDALLLIVIAIVYRPLLFTSLDEQVAQAKGIHVHAMNVVAMVLLAGVITVSVQAVGTLLIFALVVTPAATAMMITATPGRAIILSVIICLISTWGGLVLSAMFPMPPSFIIVAISTIIWLTTHIIYQVKHA